MKKNLEMIKKVLTYFFLEFLFSSPLVWAIILTECPNDNTYIYENTTFVDGLICNVEDSLNRPPEKGKQTGVLIIMTNDITLDCNFMVLNGTGTNGTFEDKFRFGIFNHGYNNVTVKDCIVQNYGDSILFINTTGSTIFNNTVISNENGIVLDNTLPSYIERFQRKISQMSVASFSKIFNNTAISNGHSYLLLYSDYNIIFNNRAFMNKFGIELENSSNNKILANNFSLDNGIFLSDDSNNNTISNNIFLNTAKSGSITLENSSYNKIFSNVFVSGNQSIILDYNSHDNILSENIFSDVWQDVVVKNFNHGTSPETEAWQTSVWKLITANWLLISAIAGIIIGLVFCYRFI